MSTVPQPSIATTEPSAEPVVAGASPEWHSLPVSLGLHLGPGVLIGAIYFATLPLAKPWGLPTMVPLCLAASSVMIPLVLGTLLRRSRGRGLKAAWREVVPYGDKLKWWQYLVWIPVVLVLAGLASGLSAPLGALVHEGLFARLPDPMPLADSSLASKGMATLWLAVCSLLLVIVVPVAEEIWFRGYLMSRIDRFKVWAPVVGTVLFALYHTWTPWHVPMRIAAVLPLSFAVWRKRNLWIGIVVHVLANSGDMIAAAVQLAKR